MCHARLCRTCEFVCEWHVLVRRCVTHCIAFIVSGMFTSEGESQEVMDDPPVSVGDVSM